MSSVEPERQLIRRVLPFVPPAIALAFVVGSAIGGWGRGWSAAIGVTVVAANFVASGLALAWGARISAALMVMAAVGGFVVRLGVIAAILVALNGLSWFSTPAFLIAVMPATIVLLAYEGRLLGGRMQADLWAFSPDQREAAR